MDEYSVIVTQKADVNICDRKINGIRSAMAGKLLRHQRQTDEYDIIYNGEVCSRRRGTVYDKDSPIRW